MTKTNDKPNIFNYATKESWQDAVVYWLLDWAGRQDVQDEGDKEDKDLHECGRRFVKALLTKHEPSLDPDIKKIKIWRQHKGIDVLARINDCQVLLIEDKTNTRAHSGQLERYYEKVVGGKTELGEVGKENLYPIFFKTGNLALAEEKGIEESVKTGRSYKIFNRKEFLEKALNHYEGSNPILTDLRAYLQAREDDANSFKDWKEEERTKTKWSWNAWEGFFRHLEKELANCGWHYVHNQQGGFLGLWWSGEKIGEEVVFLHLEVVPGKPDEQKLCFKVRVDNKENRSVARNKWHKWCMAAVAEVAGIEATKPKRFGAGRHMTVAQWGKEEKETGTWLAFNSDGRLDIKATVANLKKAEEVLDKAIAMERQGDETQS